MKRIRHKRFLMALLAIMLMCVDAIAKGVHERVNLATAGTLKEVLMDSEYDRIDSLTITGKFNSADFCYIRERNGRLANLEYIDLENVEIVESDDAYYSYTEASSSIGGYGNKHVHLYILSSTESTTSETTGALASLQTKFYHRTPNFEYAFCGDMDGWGNVSSTYKLKEIHLPKTCKNIGEYMCAGCVDLERVVLPKGCTNIGERAFRACNELMNVTNTETVDSIGFEAFYNTKIDAKFAPLKYVGDNAFENTNISSVEFSSELQRIGKSVFSKCSNLKEVNIPGSVETIGECAFYDCGGLESVTIGEGTKYLLKGCFYSCSNVKNFIVPSSILRVGFEAFKYVESLPTENVDGVEYLGSIAYRVADGNVTEMNIREGTTCIADNFLYGGKLVSVVFPSTLKGIGNWAFGCNYALESVALPEGLEYIGDVAFDGCNISSITIPSTVKSIGEEAFRGCKSLVRVNWNAVDAYVNEIFGGCSGLEQIIFGEGVKRVPDGLCDTGAYANLTGLARIRLSSTIEEIGEGAFSCTALEKIVWSEKSSLKVIGNWSFYKSTSLKESSFPKTVEVIGEYAFYQSALETLMLEEGSQLKEIGQCAFEESSLKTINLEASTASALVISGGAFSKTNLTSIALPNVKSIGNSAFSLCRSLSDVKIPLDAPLEEIGENAFYYCSALTSFEFPEKIKKIGSLVLDNTAIKTMVLPAGLESVEGAIAQNGDMKDVYVLFKDVDVAPNGVYFNNRSKAVLHVPYGAKNAFWNNEKYWNYFTSCVEFGTPSDVDVVDESKEIDLKTLIEEKNLANAVVDGIYYAVDNGNGDGYDKNECCLVLNSTMSDAQMEGINTMDGSDQSVVTQFKGMIFEIPAGDGNLEIDCQTLGTNVLCVQIGNDNPIELSEPTRDKKVVPYQVTENSRVYVYSSANKSAGAKMRRVAASANSVKIYGVKVNVEVNNNPNGVESVTDGISLYKILAVDGRERNTLNKGINIIRDKNGISKKIFVK